MVKTRRIIRNTRGRFLAKQPRNTRGRFTFRNKSRKTRKATRRH